MLTKGELIAAMDGLPDDTILEIHIPGSVTGNDQSADYEIEISGVVVGSKDPMWFNLQVGEFITECGGS